MTDMPNRRRTPQLPLGERLLYAIPLIGWMLKDVVHGERDNIFYFLFTLLACWIIAGLVFGYPGVIIPALIAVPVIFLIIVLISRG